MDSSKSLRPAFDNLSYGTHGFFQNPNTLGPTSEGLADPGFLKAESHVFAYGDDHLALRVLSVNGWPGFSLGSFSDMILR